MAEQPAEPTPSADEQPPEQPAPEAEVAEQPAELEVRLNTEELEAMEARLRAEFEEQADRARARIEELEAAAGKSLQQAVDNAHAHLAGFEDLTITCTESLAQERESIAGLVHDWAVERGRGTLPEFVAAGRMMPLPIRLTVVTAGEEMLGARRNIDSSIRARGYDVGPISFRAG